VSKLVRYFLVGGVAAAVDIGLFAWFAGRMGFDYLAVGFCTFVLATLVNYVLSIRFVFRSGIRFERRHEIALVFAISGVGLVVNQAMLFAAIGMLQLPLLLGKVVATGTVFLWNYAARSHFVFRGSP
jgi:putative flippase GtrA